MASKSISNSCSLDWDLLQRRFPEIAFQFSFGSYKPLELFLDVSGRPNAVGPMGHLHDADIEYECIKCKESLDLCCVEVVYVFGVGLGHFYLALQSWLREKKGRKLVFFEDNLSVLHALFSLDVGSELLKDSNVHVYYVSSPDLWEDTLMQCAQSWLSDFVGWVTLPSYAKSTKLKINNLKLSLERKVASVQARVCESINYGLLMENVITHLKTIPMAFHANRLKGILEDIPVVICGAGPSLQKDIDFLHSLEQRAVIIACGSAITALGHYGIKPHIAMAVDPNEEEYERLRNSSVHEVPFIYSSRLQKDAFNPLNVNQGYLCSNTGGTLEAWVHDTLDLHSKTFALQLGEEALSVTTLATAFAVEMGAKNLIYAGVDLSYGQSQRYCPGVSDSSEVSTKQMRSERKSSEKLLRRKNNQGGFVYTLVKWVMEASCIGEFAKNNPQCSFYTLSNQALPIEQVKLISQEEFYERHCFLSFDLRGLLHAETQGIRFCHGEKRKIQKAFATLAQSFEESIQLFETLLDEGAKQRMQRPDAYCESGKMSVLEMDLVDQPAYTAVFSYVFSGYMGLLERFYPRSLDSDEDKKAFLARKKVLWEVGLELSSRALHLLKNY